MKTPFVLMPLALLVAAALACGPSLGGSPALYKDNFSDSGSGWCVDSSANSSLAYLGGEYVFKVVRGNWYVWCNPSQNFTDIHVQVTATNMSRTADTFFGVICDDTTTADKKTETFYYLGFTAVNTYTITMSKNGKDTVLSEGTSPSITTNANSYSVGADCPSNGHLVLYADNKQIASATDTTLTGGDIGLFAWTGDQAPAEIHYDDVVVTKLAASK